MSDPIDKHVFVLPDSYTLQFAGKDIVFDLTTKLLLKANELGLSGKKIINVSIVRDEFKFQTKFYFDIEDTRAEELEKEPPA